MNILHQTFIELIKVLPILIITAFIAQIITFYFSKNKLSQKLDSSNENIFKSALVGIATPGPLIAYLPLIKEIKDKKVSTSIISSFITGQTLIGPGRVLLEIKYLGSLFFIIRVVLAIFIASLVGVSFKIIEKFIDF